MEDIHPNEYDIIFSKIIVLFGEEKNAQNHIDSNSEDIKFNFKETLEKKINVDLSKYSNIEKINLLLGETTQTSTDKVDDNTGDEQEENTSDGNTGDEQEENTSDGNTDEQEVNISDITKKLFKQIAILSHPDKIKDEKLNKLFVIANKEYKKNNILELMFILSKCGNIKILNEEETLEINDLIDKRFSILEKKKETVTYKWNNLNKMIKDILLEKLYDISKEA
jgi:hypothetical protein